MWKRYRITCEAKERIIANFPENVEALKYIIAKESKKEKLTEDESEKLKNELTKDLTETVETMGIEEPGTRSIFLRNKKGIYITPRNIKGWLKEVFKTLKIRGYREAVNHGVFVEPDRIYFMRNGSVIKEADEELVRPIQVIGPRGPRSSIKVAEVINAPCVFTFDIRIVDVIARGLLTKEVMKRFAELAEWVGFLGDRSLQEGGVKVTLKEI